MNQSFFINAIPSNTAQLLAIFKDKKPVFLKEFYLTGGTALSLYLGHRESEDLDFFNPNGFDPVKLQSQLEIIGDLTNVELAENTLNASIKGVKLQFLSYPYPLLEPTANWENIKLSSLIDIACTKLQTIGMRGSKKDFIDLCFILKKYSLEKLFEKLDKKYRRSNYNLPHILKSLVYFVNADGQPLPRMLQKTNWEEIKQQICKKVKKFKI